MNNKRIWLSSPHMGGQEQKYIQEAFDTNWIAPVGTNLDAFEYDLQQYLGQGHVAALNSATAAIHLALILLGVQKEDEVLVQTHTHIASVNPILYLGAIPIFIDSEMDTWNMCPLHLEAAIIDRMAKGHKPKAIIVVPLYGMPYKIEEVRALANKYEIPIIEDAAEALGSSFKGQKSGTFGDIGVLSFNGNKIITTSAGGALVCKTKELKAKALFYASQSIGDAPHFQQTEIGYNYRISTICAGIGRGQMDVLDTRVSQRRAMHDFYLACFQDIESVRVHSVPNADYFSNYWLSTILIESDPHKGQDRESLRLAFEAANIESRPLWKPMHTQAVFKNYPFYGNGVSQSLFERGLCLPSGSNLTDADRKRIEAVLLDFFK